MMIKKITINEYRMCQALADAVKDGSLDTYENLLDQCIKDPNLSSVIDAETARLKGDWDIATTEFWLNQSPTIKNYPVRERLECTSRGQCTIVDESPVFEVFLH